MRTLIAALFVAMACVAGSSCDDRDCNGDNDCGEGRVCTLNGECAQCDDNGDCGADAFCCQGICHGKEDVGALCGCGAALTGSAGTSCSSVDADSLCLVGDVVATEANVSQGTCGCGCTPDEGGPICGAPLEAGGAPVCSCEDNVDCRGPSTDASGRPHSATDTCAPDSTCVCFATAAPQSACDADGALPDCTSSGCASLDDDVANCGVPGRTCTDPAQGLDEGDGACADGGCECDAATDCVGTNINVDQCVFFGADARCVCAGYEANGAASPCPLELVCGVGGCILDGTTHATQDALVTALSAAN